MTRTTSAHARVPLDALRAAARPLSPDPAAFDPLLDRIGDAHHVLIGEASHGTHEFYRVRAEITKRLIREKGFSAVAIEGDWPDAYRVNQYARGRDADQDAAESLLDFRRFPQWMWRNADVLDFVGWLRAHNDEHPAAQVGLYGLDIYSLHASMEAVIRYLDTVDPAAAARAREHYGCFERFGADPQAYGLAVTRGWSEGCRSEVLAELVALRAAAARYVELDGRLDPDAQFGAEQNAAAVTRAEAYYRAMFGGRVNSWNLRDTHMADTLAALMTHLAATWPDPKVVVWAHNSHVGDARATEMSRSGEINIGQLARERYGDDAFLIGFSTYEGTVTAARDWDEPAERRRVRPALAGSQEELLHEVGVRDALYIPEPGSDAWLALDHPRLQRAIGVIYRPETERQSHYFHARPGRQFDALLHYDISRAVEPMERTAKWETGEVPETYPTAL